MTLVQTPFYTHPVEANYYMQKQFPNYGRFAQKAALIHEVYMNTDSDFAAEFTHKMLWKSLCGPEGCFGFISKSQIRCLVFCISRCEEYLRIDADLFDQDLLDFLSLYKISRIRLGDPDYWTCKDRESRNRVCEETARFLEENGWVNEGGVFYNPLNDAE